MKKITLIVYILGLSLANSVHADIISPGPVGRLAQEMGIWHEYSAYIRPTIWPVIIIIISILIIIKLKKIKEKKNKDNINLK